MRLYQYGWEWEDEGGFREAFDINRIIEILVIEVGFKIDPEKTLIIFDEVQEIPKALKSL